VNRAKYRRWVDSSNLTITDNVQQPNITTEYSKRYDNCTSLTRTRGPSVHFNSVKLQNTVDGLRERTEYVPQLWNWENHSQSQWHGRIYLVVQFFHPRSSYRTHLMLFSERLPTNASSYMTISGGRTEQLNIFYRVTGFTSDFRTPKTSTDICIVHDDLRCKNWTRCNRFRRGGCSRLKYVDIRSVY